MLSLFKYLNRFNANMSGRIYFWTLCILFVISFIIPAPSAGQAKVDSDFNTAQMINSPASVGMGNCVINHVNNQSAFYNPGAFGIYHLDNWLSISLPNTTKLAGFDDLLYKSFSIGLSIVDPRNIRNSENNNEVIFNLALAYSRIKFGLENVLVTNYYYPVGNENYKSYFSAFDEVDCFTVGVGIDHHIILGLGITYKHFKSTHSEKSVIETYEESVSGNMFDFGVLLEIPFSEFGEVGQNNGNKIEFGFSAAYVYANFANDFEFGRPPRTGRLGFSVKSGLIQNNNRLLSFVLRYENEDHYTVNFEALNKFGFEFGFFEFIFARIGVIERGNGTANTSGFGFNSDGLLYLLARTGINSDKGILALMKDHIHIKYDIANSDPNGVARNTRYQQLGISISL